MQTPNYSSLPSEMKKVDKSGSTRKKLKMKKKTNSPAVFLESAMNSVSDYN